MQYHLSKVQLKDWQQMEVNHKHSLIQMFNYKQTFRKYIYMMLCLMQLTCSQSIKLMLFKNIITFS